MPGDTTGLISPILIGELALNNRIIMAPLTRCRAIYQRIPNDLMAEYYRQRSSAGMILSEATAVDPMGVGYPNTPGIWNEDQVTGWKKVTDAVHTEGGLILCQLWHVGRVSHSSYLNGELPIAPSAVAPEGHVSLIRPLTPYETPRPLTPEEIPEIVAQYERGARLALRAGFDGVEIHGANGYLIDQFFHSDTNKRTDAYGGSIEARTRFLMEIVKKCAHIWGSERIGVHLAPASDSHSVEEAERVELFTSVAQQLRGEVAFLCGRESYDGKEIGPTLKEKFGGTYIANQGFTRKSGEVAVKNGSADAIAYGRLFIANPDLPKRIEINAELNTPNPETFYGDDSKGYTDYPLLR